MLFLNLHSEVSIDELGIIIKQGAEQSWMEEIKIININGN